MRSAWHVLLTGLVVGWPVSLPAQAEGEREAVLAVVQGLFDAMGARDTAAYNQLTLTRTRYLGIVDDADSIAVQWTSNAEFGRVLASSGPPFIERMWDAEVRISGPLATVWAPYDFYVGERFNHCGVDAFHLVKTPIGWRIAQIAYTVVPSADRCSLHPDGPPDTGGND